MRGRIGDPKASTPISGTRGLGGCPPRVGIDGLLRHPYAVESSLGYNMIDQTTRAEAAPGPDGDDNGPGSEPLPHGRFRYVLTFVKSRQRPPVAVGKPIFTYFPVDYLPHDRLRRDEPTDLREGDLPDVMQRRTKDPKTSAPIVGIRGLGPSRWLLKLDVVPNEVLAAPRVHRGPSTPPSGPICICVGLLLAAPRRHLCRLASRASSDLQIRRRSCRDDFVYKFTFDVANRRLTESRLVDVEQLASP
ncbi:hypothetical protein THAOC_07185 [Thalassiosira oceanica]|uniref:Uncharacterized protein n=1 Tax=Thalassiosira oceanica TaxID=159749 RepID=K0T2J2_THAOC|nr:hypothetical protein THAOC_07185 [Thalassiosira oceanica]|eukprot:EJK71384.1 hypothetical protein THAOC_07185 [Thalassiosira oceanica]